MFDRRLRRPAAPLPAVQEAGDSGDSVEADALDVGEGGGRAGRERHGRVMDENDAAGGGGERPEEVSERGENVENGVEGGLKMVREVDGGVGSRGRGGEVRQGEVMEVDAAAVLGAATDLAIMSGGADVVDGEPAGCEDVGKVEELVEVSLCRERHHHHGHIVGLHGGQQTAEQVPYGD